MFLQYGVFGFKIQAVNLRLSVFVVEIQMIMEKKGMSQLEVCEVFQKYLRRFSLSGSVYILIQVQELVNP